VKKTEDSGWRRRPVEHTLSDGIRDSWHGTGHIPPPRVQLLQVRIPNEEVLVCGSILVSEWAYFCREAVMGV
jgi:hypothetical protein